MSETTGVDYGEVCGFTTTPFRAVSSGEVVARLNALDTAGHRPQASEGVLMALAGTAFLALWNDIADARVADYDQWHTLEHVPERVSVRGFIGGRRYVNRDHAWHRYFTLYDVESLDAFANDEYRDLVENPTPWSQSMRPDFSNFLRATCAVTMTRGTGIGGAIACLCVPPAVADTALSAALSHLVAMPRISGVHCGKRSDSALAVPFKSAPAQTAPVREFDRVALIEGLDRAACGGALSTVRDALDLQSLHDDCTSGTFDLAFVFPGSDTAERLKHRRSRWDPAED